MKWHLFYTRLLFATGLLAAQVVGGQTAYVWNGGSGDWTTAANWTPNGVPAAADTAIINNGGTVTVSADTSVNTLNLTNSTLTGAATLTVTNAFNWAGGTVNGSGTLTLLATVNGTLSGAAGRVMDGGRVLNNQGTLVWTGTGDIVVYQGTWNNSGTFDIQNNATFQDSNTSGAVFNNTGTLRKSAGTGTTTFSALQSFANTGTVEVLSGIVSVPSTYSMTGSSVHRFGIGGMTAGTGHGRLLINGATTLNGALEAVLVNGFSPVAGNTFRVVTFTSRTGTFTSFTGPPGIFTEQYYATDVSVRTLGAATFTWDGATANWADPTHWVPTGVPGGGDTANVGSGTVTLNSGATVDTLNLSGGAISGAGSLVVANVLNWTGGSLNQSGTMTLPSGGSGSISGTAVKGIGFGTFHNQGTLAWTGTGSFNFGQGIWTNSGIFEIQNDASFVDTFDGAPMVLHNSGTVRKTVATGTTTFNNVVLTNHPAGVVDVQSGTVLFTSGSAFHNLGTARAESGMLTFNAGGSGTGTYEAGDAGVVRFTGGATTLAGGARLIGPGTNRVEGGTVTVSGTVGAQRLEITGGTLTGPGSLDITNAFYWNGGSISHTGPFTLLTGATGAITGASAKSHGGGPFGIQGTLVWTGTGVINFSQGTWTNSGLFEIQNDSSYVDTFDGTALVIQNSGTIRKTTASGTTTFNNVVLTNHNGGLVEIQSGSVTFTSGATFNNHGTARVQAGTLTVNAGGTSGGTFEAVSPGRVAFTGGTSTLTNGARLIGTGTNRVAGGTATTSGAVEAERLELASGTLNGTGTLTITHEFHWSGGSFGHAGTATLLAGGVGTISGATAKSYGGGSFNNQGTLVWTGAGQMGFSQGTWNNSGVFEIQNDAPFVDTFDGAPLVINNTGTLRKTTATGTTAFNNVTFTNSGTVDVRSGVLSLGGNYAPTAASTHRFAVGGYAAGAGFGRLTVSGAVTLAGQLDLMLTNSFIPTNTATFAVLTATTRTGTFSSVTGRGIGGGLYFNPAYSSTAVTLTVADGSPSFAANSAAWVDGKFQFRLNGVASETYRIDASTNLVNWSAISTNALPGSAFLDFVDNDSPAFPHRFYRGVFLP